MSVLIKGMKVPTDQPTKMVLTTTGHLYVDYGTWFTEYELLKIPSHGDLIDRDKLQEPVGSYTPIKWSYEYGASISLEDIAHAPVVIPAERSEE